MNISTSVLEGVAFIEVTGEIDLSNADQLSTAAIAAMSPSVGTIRIDLHGVTFMDSSGLKALINVRNAAGHRYAVVVQNLQPNVRRIFDFTGLADTFIPSRAGTSS